MNTYRPEQPSAHLPMPLRQVLVRRLD